jgi:serine/threonine protein kinase
MTDEAYPDALPAGYRLHWYVLEQVLGQGGFGITHLAYDTNLDRRVAIKEYLPTDFARRRSDATVRPSTEAHSERYAWGLERFLAEARTLARFDHPNVVRVVSVFEANNTAYMVMRFEEGENLATLLERNGTLSERQLLGCLLPILEGLQLVHDAGFIHRDIKPENIYVRKDGSPVLLDFGSARQSFGRSKTMTILVAPGYAPLEQYYGDPATQGPWTDIYGLGATSYRAISGRAPLDAIARAKGVLGSVREILQPATELGRGRYSAPLLAAIDHALQLSEQARPQSIAQWRSEIVAPAPPGLGPVASIPAAAPVATPAVAASALPTVRIDSVDPEPAPRGASRRTVPFAWGAVAAAGTVAAVVALVVPSRRAETPGVAATQPEPVPPSPATVAVEAAPPPAPAPLARASDEIKPPPSAAPAAAAKVVAAVREVPMAPPPRPAVSPVPPSLVPAPPAVTPTAASTQPLPPTPAPARPPIVADPSPAPAAPAAVQVAAHAGAPQQRARDDQIDAAEAALRHGDSSAAVQMLMPWAAAGVPRAQALLGRAQEGQSGRPPNYFEAYIWYSMAARRGEPGAQALKENVATRLQPAEIRQAEQVIERWKPQAEPTTGASR